MLPWIRHPGGGLVEVLRLRHEDDAGFLEGYADRHVVGPVAGEPVDLVDDAVRDLVGLDLAENSLQVGQVGALRGLAGVNELLNDDRAEASTLRWLVSRRAGRGHPTRSTLSPTALHR